MIKAEKNTKIDMTAKLKKEFNREKIMRGIMPYIYILPAFLFLGLFMLQPLIYAVEKSFFRYNGGKINEFIGWANYIRIFTKDKMFWISLKNLAYFFAAMVFTFPAPLVAAELIFNLTNKRLQNFFRTSLIIPMVVPGLVMLMIWRFIYYPGIGVFYNICRDLGVLSKDIPNLLGDILFVKPALVMIGFPWIGSLPLLVYFAALQGIDPSILEASRIDGCGSVRRIFYIDLPAIMPQIKMLFLLSAVALLQDYEKIFIVTGGGPQNASLVPGLHMYRISFPGGGAEPEFGYSCAIAVILFIVGMAISGLVNRSKGDR